MKANYIGYILCKELPSETHYGMNGRRRLVVMGRRRRRCKQVLNDLKETRRYGKLKEETLDRTFREPALKESVKSNPITSLDNP